MQSGKILIVGIFGLALAAASFAWLNQRWQGQQALEFWGVENAFLMRHGGELSLWKLALPERDAATNATTDTLVIDGQTWLVVAKRNLQHAKGILHARQALIVDASYDWTRPQPSRLNWQYAWQIRDPQGELCVVFDLESEIIRNVADTRCASLKIAAGLASFFEENL